METPYLVLRYTLVGILQDWRRSVVPSRDVWWRKPDNGRMSKPQGEREQGGQCLIRRPDLFVSRLHLLHSF